MFIFLALKNLLRNKKNNFLVILLIAVITLLFFIGNSVIGNAEKSIRHSFVESLTGEVVLEKAGEISLNLYGGNTPIIDSYFTIPVLPAYDDVMNIVLGEQGISGITSQVSGRSLVNVLGVEEPALLCGIDAGVYFSLFPGIILEEGRFLQAGEYGAMITMDRARKIEKECGQMPAVGMPALFTSGGAVGFKIREVPLVGIFSYQNPGQFMNEIVIVDSQTARILISIQVAGTVEAREEDQVLLNVNLDDLFGEPFAAAGIGDEEFSVDYLHSYINESREEGIAGETGGDWNFILIRLEKGISADAFISSLNKKIEPYGVVAVNWRTAAGTSAILVLLVQALFNAGVFLVSVAGVIAAINILLIAVFRRTREIGTLRAIGASDAYIRSLIFCENIIISIIAGFAGVISGFFLLRWINSLELKISNNLFASLIGGPVLFLDFLPYVAFLSFIVAVLLGLAASIYPVESAVRIEPMAAVRRG